MENFQIDDENRLFVMPHEDLKESEKLKTESIEFIKKTLLFEEAIKILGQKMNDLSIVVETEKLKALGEISKLENAEETKKTKCQELIKITNEKKIDLENLQNEYQSLLKVQQEQEILIEKLTNNQM